MAKVYSVTAGPNITNMRRGIGRGVAGTRLRGGVRFGAAPVLVSTAAADGVSVVGDKQLAAILGDPELKVAEISPADAKKAVETQAATAATKAAKAERVAARRGKAATAKK